jgi:WD40 repeat protein
MSAPALRSSTRGALTDLWRVRTDEFVTALAWAGDAVVAGTASGEVSVWNGASGKLRKSALAHPGGVLALAVSPNARLAATGGQDGRGRIWRLEPVEPLVELRAGGAWVEHMAWSPDGRYLAASSGRRCGVWTHDGTLVVETGDHASTVSGVAWTPHGRELVTACYGAVCFWGPETGSRIRSLEHQGSFVSLAVSPDGSVVAGGGQDATVHFWRLATGDDSQMWGYHTKPKVLAWDASSRYLATSGGPSVTVWDFSGKGPEGSTPLALEAHAGFVTALAFLRKRTALISGGDDGGVILWSLDGKPGLRGFAALEAPISAVAVRGDDGLIAAGDAEGFVAVWARK